MSSSGPHHAHHGPPAEGHDHRHHEPHTGPPPSAGDTRAPPPHPRQARPPDSHAHDRHAGHTPRMFRDRFVISLLLTLPVLYYEPLFQRL
ncbi:MAG: heavy metal translocating P-type ATPase, partial [Armatimonadota bacterium]|nr:heavy metal translocating P-type ATPase [Armatimonadota bacterium]